MSESPLLKSGGKPVPDVAEAPGGYLWDLCMANHVPFSNFGFFVSGAAKAKLDGLTDVDCRHFDLHYADSDVPQHLLDELHDANLLRPRHAYDKAPADRLNEIIWASVKSHAIALPPKDDGDD